ncbi:DUF2290 domain-containing protein [Sphingomonadaceae bacterium jetA1]|uniref:DUF2290 domain-containing protein n=1 Tax=Facivitalis istanbulensis TaxID=3075838 RepID=UPI0034814D99
MNPESVRREIEVLTADLISAGLCVDQNFPVLTTAGESAEVNFGKTTDLSVTLKNIAYVEAYAVLVKNRSYNFRLIDGGLVQLLYQFQEGSLCRHRLAFFPSPDLLEYQNNSEVYDQDDLYGDVIERNVVTVPIRFDYDPEAAADYHHPISHLTIGQYKNCRIPVSGGIGPFFFINFILRSFYNTPFRKFCSEIKESANTFAETITSSERRHLHIRVSDSAQA